MIVRNTRRVRVQKKSYGDVFDTIGNILGTVGTVLGGNKSQAQTQPIVIQPPAPNYTTPALIIGGTVFATVIGYALLK